MNPPDAALDFFAALPINLRPVAFRLRHLILQTAPGMEERLAYGIPFYYRYGRICYLNAPKNRREIELAFCHGHLLSNEQGLLASKGRREVTSVIFSSVAEINDAVLREVLQEAVLVNELRRKAD